jgi:plasmid stability protein
MNALTIPALDPRALATLRDLAAQHGRSVEEEARALLAAALDQAMPPPAPGSLAELMAGLVGPEDREPFPLPERDERLETPDFRGPEYGP